MLLTKKSEYALLSLISISKSDKPKNVDVLANELFIPKSFLAKILQNLAKSDIVKSYKGVNGGFALARGIEEITIKEITISAEDKPPSVFECSPSVGSCTSAGGCTVWPLLNNLQVKIDDFLEQLTLEDLVK